VLHEDPAIENIRRRSPTLRLLWLLALTFALAASSAARAQSGPPVLRLVRVVEADDAALGELIEMGIPSAGAATDTRVHRFSASAWGVAEPRGMTIDPATGEIFILDAAGQKIVRVVDGAGPGAQISEIDLPRGMSGLRGIAVNPADGHLHLLSPSAQQLYELDAAGRFLALRELSAPGPLDLQVMTFAPSSDRTDDPSQANLFLVTGDGSSGDSSVTEWSLAAAAQPVSASASAPIVASLLQEIDASAFDPPSPDSAGIAYKQPTDSLLMADSEVNEMSLFEGFNVFELTRSGSLFDRFDTTDFSDEPTGVAINPANGHCFFSDDTGNKSVYEVDPGSDGLCLTGNDDVTSFSTEDFGSGDPEGVAFGQGMLFVVDGVNREIYKIAPGTNGVFDGVPPSGDDQVSSCDTASLGVDDPEGIGFDSASGDLYVVGKPATQVAQISTACELVDVIDISAANATKPAGLTLAPSSVNPAVMSIWITDRGVDNNSQPNENDGRIYELSLPSATPGNTAPIVSAGPDLSIALGDVALLEGSVTDDGLPSPSSLTSTWSQVSGPGAATFDPPTQEVTNASFSASGTYLLRLTGDDGELQSIDDVTVTVADPDGLTIIETRVGASSDDAEEDEQGRVNRSSSDLELVFTGGNQTVGMRFSGVGVPPGATILEAYLQVDHAAPFLDATGDISSRPRTVAFVPWSPAPWPTVREAGPDQQTPDLSPVIQEIVDRPGWSSGNALAIIITGSGKRVAESFNGDANGAPLLHLRYRMDGP
jgi:hypothetical protein